MKKTKQKKTQNTRRTVSRMPKHEAVIQHKVTDVGRDVKHRDQTKHVVHIVFRLADERKKMDDTARWESGHYGDVVLFSRNLIKYKYIIFLHH